MDPKTVNASWLAALDAIPFAGPGRKARYLPNDVRARRRTPYESLLDMGGDLIRDMMRRPSRTAVLFGAPDVPEPLPRRQVVYERIVTVHLPCGGPKMERRTPGVQVVEDGTFIEKTE